jgi:acetoin utilization deacetylase AcuC-like enzyme
MSITRCLAAFGSAVLVAVHSAAPAAELRPLRTGFAFSDLCLGHVTGDRNPETPARLDAIVKRLAGRNLLAGMERIEAHGSPLKWITAVHAPGYVARVRDACRKGTGYMDTPDVPVSAKSWEAALAAAGCALAAVDAVMAGRVRNAFCAVRPPGHHALRDRAMGFCIFNNVAIAARYLRKKHGISRVLIADWDVHHGNGTQDAFYRDPLVFYFSVHRSEFYPGTGNEDEKGGGPGLGFTLNVPLPAGSGDKEYVAAFRDRLVTAAGTFKPDFVLVSAGFDAHRRDPLGGMQVTDAGYAELTRIVKGIAGRCCNGRLVSVLEGGYDPAGLADSVEAHVRALME